MRLSLFPALAWLAMLPLISAAPVHAVDAPQAGAASPAVKDVNAKDAKGETGVGQSPPKRICIDRNGKEFDWPWPNVPATAQCRESPAPK